MTDSAASPLAAISSSLADVVAQASPTIVSVHSHRSRASGFVWKPGLVVTADEALADEGEVAIRLADGSTEIVRTDWALPLPRRPLSQQGRWPKTAAIVVAYRSKTEGR